MPRLLILGGTAWLGSTIAGQAVSRGWAVTCLARGTAGTPVEGAVLVSADRRLPGAYDAVLDSPWDAVIDVARDSAQVASAVDALAPISGRWIYVSSASVYADHDQPDADESAARLAPSFDSTGDGEEYGPAKVAGEDLVEQALPEGWVSLRAGLIAGPGDTSDRFGYWVSRFALAGDEPVLVPDSPELLTQAIDVRDLAAFALACAESAVVGPVNAVGERIPLPDLLDEAADVAGHTGERIAVSPDWLLDEGVQPWAGDRSLPVWLPLPEYAGFMARSDARARDWGLARRPLRETLADTLADERARGLDRPRRAGLTRQDELTLISRATAAGGPAST